MLRAYWEFLPQHLSTSASMWARPFRRSVREEDRRRLREMFGHYRLTPKQHLSRQNVRLLDESELPYSRVHGGLKHLWVGRRERSDRRRCVRRARDWDGLVEDGGSAETAAGQLVLIAAIRIHPNVRLTLGLAARAVTPLPEGEYALEAEAGSDPPLHFGKHRESSPCAARVNLAGGMLLSRRKSQCPMCSAAR